MKRILLAFDGEHLSKSVLDCAVQMNSVQPVHAVGCFLPAVDYAELLYSFGGVMSGPIYITEVGAGDEKVVKKNIADFTELCKQYDVACSVFTDDTRHIVSMIRDETRFADLLVIDGSSFYKNAGAEIQKEYLTNVMHKSECPVLIVTRDYKPPKSIILAYDGSEQSVFAIKQFFSMFPYDPAVPVLLVYFGDKDEKVPQKSKIEQLLSCYCRGYVITKLDFHKQKDIEDWLITNNDPIVVTGAHSRSSISELIHKSFVTTITRDSRLMVFVAHK